MILTYARDLGSWHCHLVPPDPAQPDGLRETAICGLGRFSPTWPQTGPTILQRYDLCRLCVRSANKRGYDYPPLPIFAVAEQLAA